MNTKKLFFISPDKLRSIKRPNMVKKDFAAKLYFLVVSVEMKKRRREKIIGRERKIKEKER